MKIVIDTNILISALINPDGKESNIILKSTKIKFYSCYQLYIEIFKHKDKIVKCSNLKENEILELLYILFKKIEFINEE